MANYTNHKNNKPLSDEQKAAIKYQVEVLKLKSHQVAENLGVSASVVRKYSRSWPSPETRKKAKALVLQGVSRSQASKQLAISRTIVGRQVPGIKSEALTDAIKEKLFEKVRAGKYVGSAANELGIDRGHARMLVAREKIVRGSTCAVLRERVRLGEMILPVAKELHISVGRAYEAAGSLMTPPEEAQSKEIKRRLENTEEPEAISADLNIRLAFVLELQKEPEEFLSDGLVVSDATKERAEKLHLAGLNAQQIGERLRLTRQQVGLIIQSTKKKQPTALKVDDKLKKNLVAGIRGGKSIANLAREFGITISYAHKIVSVEYPPPTEEEAIEMRRLGKEGKGYAEIARLLKTYEGAVTSVLGPRAAELSAEDELAIARAYARGQTRVSIAALWEIHESRVKTIYDSHVEQDLVKPRITCSMEDDKNLDRIDRLYPEYGQWRIYVIDYYKVVKGNFAIVVTAIHRFFDFLAANQLPTNPADFFLRNNRSKIPPKFRS